MTLVICLFIGFLSASVHQSATGGQDPEPVPALQVGTAAAANSGAYLPAIAAGIGGPAAAHFRHDELCDDRTSHQTAFGAALGMPVVCGTKLVP